MNKYEVSLQYSHDFEIDCKGLCKWAKDNLSLDMVMRTDNWISFQKEGALTPTDDEDYKSDEHKQLHEHYLSLTEEGEDTKLALPSRLEGQALQDWKVAKKESIASETDFSQLSEAQKKLWMGLPLTDDEMDSLGA